LQKGIDYIGTIAHYSSAATNEGERGRYFFAIPLLSAKFIAELPTLCSRLLFYAEVIRLKAESNFRYMFSSTSLYSVTI
jgi:hypothetical protein